ncbi:flagellar basal body rod protein FlgB [Caulobacter segnis]|uniref:flagellar basal body rod protein FlgB n=1 Tax=Caulobacter segnis TaxID=88688 RepID=UPI00240FE47D|nr:flagellar basal body rod protein FlgB [Caulobacter segnis]MDG2522708.1 flagellar basal body rod protein FlgB [Caulobacter segnis]
MLKSRLGYLGQRERVIAENVANSDTPGFKPKDLRGFTFEAALGPNGMRPAVSTTHTSAMHLSPPKRQISAQQRELRPQEAPDSDITLDGNAVSLEDQMLKMADAKMNYDAAIGFYQKSLGLLRMAAQKPR